MRNLIVQIEVEDSVDEERLLQNLALAPGVIAVTPMEYDGTGGFDPVPDARITHDAAIAAANTRNILAAGTVLGAFRKLNQ